MKFGQREGIGIDCDVTIYFFLRNFFEFFLNFNLPERCSFSIDFFKYSTIRKVLQNPFQRAIIEQNPSNTFRITANWKMGIFGSVRRPAVWRHYIIDVRWRNFDQNPKFFAFLYYESYFLSLAKFSEHLSNFLQK